MRKWSNSR